MKLLAIDGNSILNRAYYGIRPLSNQKGIYTNAILGFCNIYLKNIGEVKPDAVAIAFDLRSPTFRHKAVASYKANRKGMPEELAQQLPLVKQLFAAMGIRIVECEGYEADDVLGTLAGYCSAAGEDCVILTGDRDSLQLLDEHVSVRLATTKETILYTPERFAADYGFPPPELIDLKALMGDSSDNISGVPGIGEKTATALVQAWGTVENLYAHLAEAEVTKGVRAKLEAGVEAAQQSKWLATIVRDAPVPPELDEYRPRTPDQEAVAALLTELEMYRLLEKLNLQPAAAPQQTAQAPDQAALCRETGELTAEALTALLAAGKPVDFLLQEETLYLHTGQMLCTTAEMPLLTAFLGSDCPKRTFAAKPVWRLALRQGISLENLAFDGELAAYLESPADTDYTIARLCTVYGLPYDAQLGEFADIAALPGLCDTLSEKLKADGMEDLLLTVEQPLTRVLAEMEHAGVRVDADGVRRFGAELTEDLDALQEQIFFMAGHDFNIGSPKQLGVVLFEELGLPAKKKTKSGYSTNAEVLEDLRSRHPIVDLVLRWRQLSKLSSTYVDGLLKTIGEDGRIHTWFRQTETRTGRISSTEPNMQNIPVRTQRGREMRKFFIAAPDMVLLDADYSQIELRILAHLAGDAAMQEAFRTGKDIHAATAAQVFNMPPELVSAEMRSAAKAVNFGIIYGIGAFSLSKDIGVSVAQADRYIRDYLRNFASVEQFMEHIVENARKDGYVTTMFGRRRFVPDLQAKNKNLQAAGRRIAMNTPIQGTAADIIKIAMVRVAARLREAGLQARLILQVHDELIVEATRADAAAAAEILRTEMEGACKLAVPLTADVHEGESWYAAKG